MLPIIRQTAESGVGVLLVEQFTHQALSLAANALVVLSGRVTFQGEAATLIAQPELLHEAYLGGTL